MRKGLRRKYHREAVKLMRILNQRLQEDFRIKGRFMVMEKAEQFELFADGSGGLLHVLVRCYDRMHDEYKDYQWEFAPYFKTNEWDLCMGIMNDFACAQMLDHRDTLVSMDFKGKVNVSEINSRPTRLHWGW